MLDSSDEFPPTRAPYKGTEDRLIIGYICENKEYSNVKGRAMWEQMSLEFKSKKYHRSWHSLKERYRKYIIPNISSYQLSENEVNNLLKPYKKTKYQVKTGKAESSGKKWVAYSLKEDKIIIKHVLEEEDDVSGNLLWLKLEKMKLLRGRSWQSLRGHFLNVILKNIDDIVDKETCDKVRKRVYGDLDFVVYTDEENNPKRVRSPKKQKNYLRIASPCRHETVTKEKTLATLPCSEPVPVPSTSQLCSVRPPATSSPRSQDSDSDQISSSFTTVKLLPAKAKKRKLFTMHSTDSVLSEGPNPHSPSASANEEPRTKSAGNPSLSKVPMVVLERCDPKTAEARVASSVSSNTTIANTTSQKMNSVDSTIFNATTLRISRPRDCCCEDFKRTAGEITPCGSACRNLQEASKKSPVKSSQRSREQGRASAPRKLPEWLCKPVDCRRSSANSSETAEEITPSGSACRNLQEASKKSPVKSSQRSREQQGRASAPRKLSEWLCKPLDCRRRSANSSETAEERTPCGNTCRNLQEASKKSPVRSSQRPREQGRAYSRKLTEWLCKPRDCRRSSTNSAEPTPENVINAQAKTELQVSKPEQMVIYTNFDEEKIVFSDLDDDDDSDIVFDPIFGNYVNNSCLCFEGDECKMSLGPILFPVVHPWD